MVVTTGSLTEHLNAAGVPTRLLGDDSIPIRSFDAFDAAGPGALTFYRSARYASAWATGSASAALVTQDLVDACLGSATGNPARGRALLVVKNVDVACARVLPLLAPPAPARVPGVHPSAVVDPGARVSADASVGPLCVVGPGASIDDGVVLAASVHVGAGARIGRGSFLHPGVRVLDGCVVGAECVLHAGVVIGADGFGYASDAAGHHKIPHIGNVVLGDRVEVGANTCIDRAKFGSTTVGEGTKIDNLVQIAHNCRIGPRCIICGHCGIAGSVEIGEGTVIGGMVGIADGIAIGPGVQIGAHAGVITNIPAKSVYFGQPAGPAREMRRNYVAFRSLADSLAELRKLLPDRAPKTDA